MKTITKIKMQRIVATLITIVLIMAGIIVSNKILERKDSCIKWKPFFEGKKDYDVLFFGNSHMLNGIFPMQLWNEYGITSYNCAYHGQATIGNLCLLKILMKYCRPKYVVVDAFGLGSSTQGTTYAHDSFDELPLSYEKVKAFFNLFTSREELEEMLVPFSIYHNRWCEFDKYFIKDEFDFSGNKQKGADARVRVLSTSQEIYDLEEYIKANRVCDYENNLELEENKKNTIKAFISFCNENDIALIIVNIPEAPNIQQQKELSAVKEFINQENISYYDFCDKNFIDYELDLFEFMNDNNHLNPSGARKTTACMGEILRNDFNLPDHRNDSAYSNWNNDYEDYREFLFEQMRCYNDFDTSLMLCNNSNFKVELFVKENTKLTTRQQKLIAQLKDSIKVSYVSNDLQIPDIRLVVLDSETNNTVAEKNYDLTLQHITPHEE